MTATVEGTRDVGVVLPVPDTATLRSGTEVQLQELAFEQFFKLLRIVTKPTGSNLAALPKLDPDGDPDEFLSQLLLLMFMSIPEAIPETRDFLLSMVEPVGLRTGRHLNNQAREHNKALREALAEELANPNLDDLLTLVEAVVRREVPNLVALGKRLGRMLNLAKRSGLTPRSQTSQG